MLCWLPAALIFRCGIIAATAASCSTSQAGPRANAPRGTSFESSLVTLPAQNMHVAQDAGLIDLDQRLAPE
jgi:hypothetical protein